MFKLTEPDNLELFPKNMNKNRVKTFEKRTNKNFYSFVIPFNNNWKGKFLKTITIEYYTSGQTGTKARHAISGELTNFTVGKMEEHKLFKVNAYKWCNIL